MSGNVGDTFTSAFLVKYSEYDWTDQSKFDEQMKQCLVFGNCAAFLCIIKKGAMPSLPWRKDLDVFLDKYINNK